MKRNQLNGIVAAIAFGLSTGCAATGPQTAWTKTVSFFRPGSSVEEDAAEPDAMATLKKNAKEQEELSEEFLVAQKTLKDPETSLLRFAQYQEDLGEYGEARKKYREMLTAYPKNIDARLGMARIEMKTGRSQQAEEILLSLVKEKPRNTAVRLELGRMYSEQDDWDRAIQAYQAACDLTPEDQGCRYELGVALAKSGKIDQALSHLTYAVGAPAANYNIGYVLQEQGRVDDAIEWYQNALSMHPDRATEERSQAMLAQLIPDESSQSDPRAIAQHRTTGKRSPGRSQPTTHRRIVEQFTPAPVGLDGFSDDSATIADRPSSAVELPPVIAGQSRSSVNSQTIAPPVAPKSPFKTVSYSEDDTVGKATYPGNQPTQWRGSAPGNTQPLPPVTTNAGAQEPPSWRARQK